MRDVSTRPGSERRETFAIGTDSGDDRARWFANQIDTGEWLVGVSESLCFSGEALGGCRGQRSPISRTRKTRRVLVGLVLFAVLDSPHGEVGVVQGVVVLETEGPESGVVKVDDPISAGPVQTGVGIGSTVAGLRVTPLGE